MFLRLVIKLVLKLYKKEVIILTSILNYFSLVKGSSIQVVSININVNKTIISVSVGNTIEIRELVIVPNLLIRYIIRGIDSRCL